MKKESPFIFVMGDDLKLLLLYRELRMRVLSKVQRNKAPRRAGKAFKRRGS